MKLITDQEQKGLCIASACRMLHNISNIFNAKDINIKKIEEVVDYINDLKDADIFIKFDFLITEMHLAKSNDLFYDIRVIYFNNKISNPLMLGSTIEEVEDRLGYFRKRLESIKNYTDFDVYFVKIFEDKGLFEDDTLELVPYNMDFIIAENNKPVLEEAEDPSKEKSLLDPKGKQE